MGVGLNWIAVQGGDGAALLQQCGLASCGAASDEVGSEFACAVLPGGWFVLVSGKARLNLEGLLSIASVDRAALGGEVEEHVNFSRLLGYRDGRQAWAVTHDPEVGCDNLSVEGEPPAPFEDIRSDLVGRQEADAAGDVDYMFDLPVRLGQRLCGYCVDQAPPVEWTVLERIERRSAPRETPRLAAGIRSELLPWLHSLGWTPANLPGSLEFDEARTRDGDCERLWLQWRDDPSWLWISVSFAVLDEAAAGSSLKIGGDVRLFPQRWRRRSTDRLLSLGRKPPSYKARVAATLARARDELLVVERFLAHGERDPRLSIRRRNAADARGPAGGMS